MVEINGETEDLKDNGRKVSSDSLLKVMQTLKDANMPCSKAYIMRETLLDFNSVTSALFELGERIEVVKTSAGNFYKLK